MLLSLRSLRSRFCTERYSDARYLNAEFSHTLGSDRVKRAEGSGYGGSAPFQLSTCQSSDLHSTMRAHKVLMKMILE